MDHERTKTLVKDLWKVGYTKVTIEEDGQMVYAFPDYTTFRKKKMWGAFPTFDLERPPLWDLCTTILGRGGCSTGSGQGTRGDRAQNCTDRRLVSGVYIKGLGHPLFEGEDDESTIVSVEKKLEGHMVREITWCSHGQRLKLRDVSERTSLDIARKERRYTGCSEGCFDDWNRIA